MSTPTIPAGNLYMNATLYTGNSSTQTITNGSAGASFQPDMVWVKDRTAAQWNNITDSVRGVGKEIFTNATNAEETNGGISSLNSNGFSLINWDGANKASDSYVAWNWKAGGTAVTNTDGSITSQVSANTTSGFSVVTWTATGSVVTVGHGLGAKPSIIITKQLSTGDWAVITDILTGTPQYLYLNTTQAVNNTGWGTNPTSTVFSGYSFPSGQAIVSYCWTPIAGFSQFGSYTGNGSTDGPFVYTGFRPRFVMFKRTDATEQWAIRDTSRDPYNASELELFPNLSNAEEDNNLGIDIVSNGFKIRNSSNRYNASGGTYIYMAFAENPFKYANAR